MWREEQTEVLRVLADVYLDQGQADKARTLLEALMILAPHDAGVIRALSYAHLLAGRYEEVLATTDALLRLDAAMPDNAPALLIRGKALWALGQATEARDSLRRYLELGGGA